MKRLIFLYFIIIFLLVVTHVSSVASSSASSQLLRSSQKTSSQKLMISPARAFTIAHDTATASTPTSSIETNTTGTSEPTEPPPDNQKKVCPPATVGLEYEISAKTVRVRVDSGNDEDTCVIDAYNIQWSTTADFQSATTKHHVHTMKRMHSLMLQPAIQSQSQPQSVVPSRHHSRPLHTSSSDIMLRGQFLLPSLSYHVRVMGLMKHEHDNNTYDISIPVSQDPDVVEIPIPIDMGDNPIIWYEMILNLTSATAEKDIRDYYTQQKLDFITGIINDVGVLLQIDNAKEYIYPDRTCRENHYYGIKIKGSDIAQKFMEFFILTGVGEGKDGIVPTHRNISSSSLLFQKIQGITNIKWLIQCPHSDNIIWATNFKQCQHATTKQDLGGFFSIHPILTTMLVVAAIGGAVLCMMFRKGSYQTTSITKFVPVDSADMDDDIEGGHSSKPLSSHVDDDDDDNCDGDHGTMLKPVAVGLDI